MSTRTPFTKAEKRAKQAECLAKLREMLSPGDRLYTVLTHRSASGMSRRVKLLRAVVTSPEEKARVIASQWPALPAARVESIGWYAAHALGLRLDYDTHEITLQGCGMDMGFDLVYQLGSALWPEGTPEPHSTRNGVPDRDGGYALKHEWL